MSKFEPHKTKKKRDGTLLQEKFKTIYLSSLYTLRPRFALNQE